MSTEKEIEKEKDLRERAVQIAELLCVPRGAASKAVEKANIEKLREWIEQHAWVEKVLDLRQRSMEELVEVTEHIKALIEKEREKGNYPGTGVERLSELYNLCDEEEKQS